jgi:hypothetical protein
MSSILLIDLTPLIPIVVEFVEGKEGGRDEIGEEHHPGHKHGWGTQKGCLHYKIN